MSNTKEEVHIGTPFMDGVLSACAQHGLDENQVAEVLEKGAAAEDTRVKTEMQGFIDRVVAAQNQAK